MDFVMPSMSLPTIGCVAFIFVEPDLSWSAPVEVMPGVGCASLDSGCDRGVGRKYTTYRSYIDLLIALTPLLKDSYSFSMSPGSSKRIISLSSSLSRTPNSAVRWEWVLDSVLEGECYPSEIP